MRGKAVFYPMGWDDNGLPTERRVQNFYGVRCDPTVPNGQIPDEPLPKGETRSISRPDFIELCHRLTAEDEKGFEDVWRTLGLSVDWKLTYATIDDRSRRVAQRAFLRNLARGEAYSQEAPTVWDVDFQTAVAQAEIEDREQQGAMHKFAFPRTDGHGVIEIETTRPELVPSCVALVAHPDDERYAPLAGQTVKSPLFEIEVPIVLHPLAEPDKGTGIAMICTFGDTKDVTWWRELDLPLRAAMRRDGRFQVETPAWLEAKADVWAQLGGKNSKQARRIIVELLTESGDLIGEPKPVQQQVKFFEKGDRPLEVVTSRQWYIRNGGRDEDLRQELLARGRALNWNPEFMETRYEHWVEGLNGDWLISRQRYFGVPFPVWYRLDEEGEPDHDHPILPEEAALPVDPQSDAPVGYTEDQRGKPGGFIGDPDVMDTWATSSLSPQIACGWEDDPDLFARTFPMDVRPQGPEIIRTWLFSTVVRSHYEHGTEPWKDTLINGWILDPDRKKMSKSRGSVTTPMPLIDEFGADGVRYWALKAAPGADTAVDKAVFKNGRRLSIKLLNASKFVLGVGTEQGEITEPIDRALLQQLAAVVDDATASFEGYRYQQALARIEAFFWRFCDEYLELVKNRAYNDAGNAGGASAQATLGIALSTIQRLLAPFTPFVTEGVWSWWQEGSVHRTSWPSGDELRSLAGEADAAVFDVASEVLGAVHKAKTSEQRSLRTHVLQLVIADTAERLSALRQAEADIRGAGNVDELILNEGPELQVTAELEPETETAA
jgi:valyl-tRNA synthetase